MNLKIGCVIVIIGEVGGAAFETTHDLTDKGGKHR
jgi:hypothetical protein